MKTESTNAVELQQKYHPAQSLVKLFGGVGTFNLAPSL